MIKLTAEIKKSLAGELYYTEEYFIKDCKVYIKALKSGRLQYKVTHVSQSSMSRNINISSYEGTMLKGHYRSYTAMLTILGYKLAGEYSSDIKVSGGGMNMLFYTNYSIIHKLHNMKFISKKNCDILSQKI